MQRKNDKNEFFYHVYKRNRVFAVLSVRRLVFRHSVALNPGSTNAMFMVVGMDHIHETMSYERRKMESRIRELGIRDTDGMLLVAQ